MSSFDLAIVGSGPAGMAAAITAAEMGLRAVVFDEQREPGGQIYRSIETVRAARASHLSIFGDDYARGAALVQRFRAASIDYRPGTQVWSLGAEGRVFYRAQSGTGAIEAEQIIIATGAMERPFPVPGWTLPGVLTCGAAQTALKSAGLVPEGRIVLAGSGPLLLLLAVQLVRAGVRPTAILETSFNALGALKHALGFFSAPAYVAKGLSLLRERKRSGVQIFKAVRALEISGDERVRGVTFESGGVRRELPADLVLLHHGVVPNGNLAWSNRLEHVWDEGQRCFKPKLDRWGRSSLERVFVAGDSGGIVGAIACEHSGRLAALGAAAACGRISEHERDRRAASTRFQYRQHLAARPFLDALYRPSRRWLAPRDAQTIVCRCEEVNAAAIRKVAAEHDCPGPNQLKAFMRCGMGPCQGRLCGLTVVEMLAECRGVSPAEIGYYRIRSPIKPVSVGELAELDLT
jgi:NADPH-dependent 2,4-dienoyl-CoA reductase/sulfur reductase-like enzyme